MVQITRTTLLFLVISTLAAVAQQGNAFQTTSVPAKTKNSKRDDVLRNQLLFISQQHRRSTMSSTVTNKKLQMSSTDDDDSWNLPSQPSRSAMIGGAGVNNAGEPPFEIRGFSLGNLVIGAGIVITLASFADYLSQNNDSLSVSGLGFVYGIPVFLAGAALKYAEIEPVPVYTNRGADTVFEQKATETIRKIKQDVTRHRYGDEAHLDTTVKKLGLVVPGKAYPQLRELREDKTPDGELIFTIVWQSLDTPYKMWADERRVKKYETFFGPGITADVIKIDAEQRLVGIQLTTVPKGGSSSTSTPIAETTTA